MRIIFISRRLTIFFSVLAIAFNAAATLAFDGQIALTFDDAPTADSALMTGAERSHKILQALQRHQVKDVLFFVKADNISAQTKARLQLYTNAGMHLANHSFSHTSAKQLSANDFLVDVYRAQLALGEFDNVLPYFRFPFLHYGKDLAEINYLQQKLHQLGYRDGFITVDNFDWYINDILVKAAASGKAINYAKAQALYVEVIWEAILFFDNVAKHTTGRSPPHILLLHENDTTALFLDALINHIKHHGGHIVSPQAAYDDPAYNEFPATDFQGQGRIAALAASRGTPIEQLRHPAENTAYLDALFKKRKVIK